MESDDGGDGSGSRADTRPYHHGDLRTALLDAAETELAAAGIEKLSLRAVAKRAGVSHAAPAHHFGDATGLLTALAARGYDAFDARLRAAGDAEAAPRARIEAAGVAYVNFAMQSPALFRLMFSSARPDFDDPALGAASERSYETLAADIAHRSGESPFRSEAAMADMTIAWGLVHGIADLMNAGRMRSLLCLPPDRRDLAVRALVRRAIGRGRSEHG